MRQLPLFLIACAAFASVTNPPESVQDLLSRLSAEQKTSWDQAMQSFNAQQYADALVTFKRLLVQMPGDAILSKFASEAALNVGDRDFAARALKPLAGVDSNDWQAVSLLARTCAESGDTGCRDSNMAHLRVLHQQGIVPQNIHQYLLESLRVGANMLIIIPSLEPIGIYNIFYLGRVMNQKGSVFQRITIESGNDEQSVFAKAHPKEAAQGLRSFSLDGYVETGLNSNGQRTQAHFTYKFYAGEPSYEIVRKAFIEVASGKARPISSRTGLVIP